MIWAVFLYSKMSFTYTTMVNAMNILFICLVFSFLGSIIGSLIVLFMHKMNRSLMAVLYGGAAGIMLAACFFSLLLPALDSHQKGIIFAFVLGIGLLFFIDHNLVTDSEIYHSRAFRLILTMGLHNLVQGLALGISFSFGKTATSVMLGLGLVMQNIPEGAATALSLSEVCNHQKKSFFYASLLSFIEIPMCFIGLLSANLLNHSIAYLWAFAASILLYTIIEEMLPDAWAYQRRPLATLAFLSGFCIIMLLQMFYN